MVCGFWRKWGRKGALERQPVCRINLHFSACQRWLRGRLLLIQGRPYRRSESVRRMGNSSEEDRKKRRKEREMRIIFAVLFAAAMNAGAQEANMDRKVEPHLEVITPSVVKELPHTVT